MTDSRRRVLIRVIGAPLLLAALGGILYWDYHRKSILGLTIIMGIFTLGGLYEFYTMCRSRGYQPDIFMGLVAALASVLIFVPGLVSAIPGNFLWIGSKHFGFILIGYLLLKMIFRYGRFTPVDAALTYLGFIYLTLWLLLLHADGRWMFSTLLFFIAVNKGNDMAAYIFGKLFGRTKLAPQVSPNKTWVGTVAGVVAGAVLGIFVLSYTKYNRIDLIDVMTRAPYLLLFSVLVTISATLGDLIESAIKRWAEVKDSGTMLPEFGGFLDMIDGFLISIPFAFGLERLELALVGIG